MNLLPHWVLTDKFPAFFESDSKTAIEQTARVYAAMQELITDYNKFVDNINNYISEFSTATNKDYEVFKVAMRQEFQDFIDVIDLKMKAQDKEIADAVDYMKNNLRVSIKELISGLRVTGELNQDIIDCFADFNEKITEVQESISNESNTRQQAISEVQQNLSTMKIVTPQMYGAKGDGVTNDRPAIELCLSENKAVYFPAGKYLIDKEITINDQYIIGAGKNTCFTRTNGGQIFIVNGISKISNLSIAFEFETRPESGFAITLESTYDSNTLSDIFIENCYGGVLLHDLSGTYINNLTIENSYYNALELEKVNDVYLSNIIFSNVGIGNNFGTGLTFRDYVQAIEMNNVNIIGFCNTIAIVHTGSNFVTSNSASYCVFNNCYFDGSLNEFRLIYCNGFKFSNCWFSNRASGCSVGIYAYNTNFTNCQFRNNDNNGFIVFAGSKNTFFTNCDFINNRNHGILLETDSNNAVFISCNIGNDFQYMDYNFSQENGITIVETVTDVIISGCIIKGNTANQINNLTNNVESIILSNNITS